MGLAGEAGPSGSRGESGKSAYQLAVEEGFQGSLKEWLESLKGRDGKDGGAPSKELIVKVLDEHLEIIIDDIIKEIGEIKGAKGDKGDPGPLGRVNVLIRYNDETVSRYPGVISGSTVVVDVTKFVKGSDNGSK